MRAKTFLEIHKALLHKKPLTYGAGEIDEYLFNGLCAFWIGDIRLRSHPIFKMFIPTDQEINEYKMDNAWFFDTSESLDYEGKFGGEEYNDMRQNVILLCAAINGEL
jgi:hypothetical protein